MTTPTSGLFAQEVIDGLRVWAATREAWVKAAVELLIEHEHWIRRDDFLANATAHYPEEGMVVIRWNDADEFALRAEASTSEMAILKAAIDLGSDRYRIGNLGNSNRQALARAFTAATVGAW